MMSKHGSLMGILLIGLVPACVGCSGKAKTEKVQGTVTLDGQPLSRAVVSFLPVGDGRLASGLTDEAGMFRLTTFSMDDGALPGEYKVIVTREEAGESPETSSVGEPLDRMDKHAPKKVAQEGRRKRPPSPVPPIYRTPDKTPLRQVVPTDGEVLVKLSSKYH